MDIRVCHVKAAHMLAGPTGQPDLLHAGLFDDLTEVDDLVRVMGGELFSRQVIAAVIYAWRNANPGARPYGDS